MDLRERRDLNRDVGDGLARGFELVFTPLVAGLIGWFIDSATGTTPVVTIVLAVAAVTAQVVKLWYAYDSAMRQLEDDVARRKLPGVAPASGEQHDG